MKIKMPAFIFFQNCTLCYYYLNHFQVGLCHMSPHIFKNDLIPFKALWKLNPRDRTITLTKLLIKHEKLTPKETEIGA